MIKNDKIWPEPNPRTCRLSLIFSARKRGVTITWIGDSPNLTATTLLHKLPPCLHSVTCAGYLHAKAKRVGGDSETSDILKAMDVANASPMFTTTLPDLPTSPKGNVATAHQGKFQVTTAHCLNHSRSYVLPATPKNKTNAISNPNVMQKPKNPIIWINQSKMHCVWPPTTDAYKAQSNTAAKYPQMSRPVTRTKQTWCVAEVIEQTNLQFVTKWKNRQTSI